MTLDADAFAASLARAVTVDDLLAAMEARVKTHGYDGFLYWTHLRKPLEELSNADAFGLSRGPIYMKAFESLYFGKKLYLEDPVTAAAMERTEPFTTREVRAAAKAPKTRRLRWLYALEARFGFGDDIYIPLHSPLRVQVFYAFCAHGRDEERRAHWPAMQLDAARFAAAVVDFVMIGDHDGTANLVFSRRELECLMWMAKGRTNRQIAEALDISERTVKFHVRNLTDKLQASNRTEAVAIAARSGWLMN